MKYSRKTIVGLLLVNTAVCMFILPLLMALIDRGFNYYFLSNLWRDPLEFFTSFLIPVICSPYYFHLWVLDIIAPLAVIAALIKRDQHVVIAANILVAATFLIPAFLLIFEFVHLCFSGA